MNLENCRAYELVKEQSFPEFGSMGCLLRHRRTGARVALISNDDENKVFYVGFRTPPADHTGAAHIVEHTVLCGSRRFPVKDPFVELVKGSLNTFLNAMTYPDKTLYPVASVHDGDFKNLMHVYLDAVFCPNIYRQREIFWQEGWHYELENPQAPITLNGVVYNEMKGAYSSPESLLNRRILEAMNPENAYAFSAAGDPEEIPKLTYQQFLDFHRRYYHPSNSYLYLYGNIDMEERLDWMDREYLSRYDYLEVDSAIRLQKPFLERHEVRRAYPVAGSEPLCGNTWLSVSFGIGTALDQRLGTAFQILKYALLDCPGAPLKQALLDAGIGKDITGAYHRGMLQPIFSIVAGKSDPGKKDAFLQIIRRVLKEQAEGALNHTSLLAGLNRLEFDFREADFGRFPRGLLWGLRCMDSWLYEDHSPFLYLSLLPVISWLREQIDAGYFEGLIRDHLLDNPHQAFVSLEPEHGGNARREQKLAEELAAYKASLSPAELERLAADTAALQRYQKEPSSQEALKTIPMLSRNDLRREARGFLYEERTMAGIPALFHPVRTEGIVYVNLLFDTARAAEEDIPYLGILKAVLGYVDTERYSYQVLSDEINLHTGGISGSLGVYSHIRDEGFATVFELKARCLCEKTPRALELMGEILTGTRLTDFSRLYEILARLKGKLREKISSSGDSVSSLRAMSCFSAAARYRELTGGIAFYQLVSRLEEHYEEEKEQLVNRLKELIALLFCRENLLVSVGGQEEGYEAVASAMPVLGRLYRETGVRPTEQSGRELTVGRPEQPGKEAAPGPTDRLSREAVLWQPGRQDSRETVADRPACGCRKEGFLTASQVQDVSRAGNFRKAGYEYTGAMKILQVIFGYEYLWQNIRVKGGAYGCGARFSRNGDSSFSSYRDPNLEETDQVYLGCGAYLRNFAIEERDMTKYVIGAISGLDRPLTPAEKVQRSLAAYFTGLTLEELQRERDQVLDADQADIRALAGPVEAVLKQQALCVIGNEEHLKKREHMFDILRSL